MKCKGNEKEEYAGIPLPERMAHRLEGRLKKELQKVAFEPEGPTRCRYLLSVSFPGPSPLQDTRDMLQIAL